VQIELLKFAFPALPRVVFGERRDRMSRWRKPVFAGNGRPEVVPFRQSQVLAEGEKYPKSGGNWKHFQKTGQNCLSQYQHHKRPLAIFAKVAC